MQFRQVFPNFHSCVVELDGNSYASGVVLEEPLEDRELVAALEIVGQRLEAVQELGLQRLRSEVFQMLQEPDQRSLLARSELLSISAAWNAASREPVISLAYGFDDGVCIVGTMQGGAITAAEPADE